MVNVVNDVNHYYFFLKIEILMHLHQCSTNYKKNMTVFSKHVEEQEMNPKKLQFLRQHNIHPPANLAKHSNGYVLTMQKADAVLSEVIATVSQQELAKVARPIVQALRAGMFHNDMHAGNFLCFGDTWYLIDFETSIKASKDIGQKRFRLMWEENTKVRYRDEDGEDAFVDMTPWIDTGLYEELRQKCSQQEVSDHERLSRARFDEAKRAARQQLEERMRKRVMELRC
jgi:thiamine kinase-like enzyme